MERKLTAILSADVKGYSRLMGEDEVATIRTLTAYQEAMALEDGLVYEEPPAWYVPIREELGRAYFDAGQYAESEKAFRDDLSYWRDNPWSMRGLARSLRRQGKNPEAAELEKKLPKETPG